MDHKIHIPILGARSRSLINNAAPTAITSTSTEKMAAQQEPASQYQKDEGTAWYAGAAKRDSSRDQRHHPCAGAHDREDEDRAQPRHVYHRIVYGGFRLRRESLCAAKGEARGDAG